MRESVVGVAGLGLIGSSIARCLAPSASVTAFDPNAAARRAAADLGVRPVESIAGLATCDVVILAAPTQSNTVLLQELMASGSRPVVMDAGSVKSGIVGAWLAVDPTFPFVATHPMAGSEEAGFAAGRADLFQEAPWPVVVTTQTDAAALASVLEIITALGGQPIPVSAQTHDQSVAEISHLPHLLAGALGNVVVAPGPNLLAVRLAAGSFRDLNRISAAPVERTAEFLAANAGEAALRARQAAAELNRAAALLEACDTAALIEWLRAAHTLRVEQGAVTEPTREASADLTASELLQQLLSVRDSGTAVVEFATQQGNFDLVLSRGS
ncbi:MAG: prephenate dehydrogenase/arogenate dehydrogenase family protein [Actinomycetia bacterium]|nr:prephenate dehydrogenase/arogenate dehydrogenase family protein [Actinomycetes bacterium]